MGSERPDSGSGDNIVLLEPNETATRTEGEVSKLDKNTAKIEAAHKRVLAAFNGEAELKRPYRLIEKLSNLDKRWLRSAEHLEAIIMIRVMTRTRPAKAVGDMRRLRQRRKRDGQMDQFTQFEARVTEYLGGRPLSNHGYDRTNFKEIDHTPIWSQIKSHISTLEEKDYEVFLNSGTLLGVVRDGQLISHDNDVDLAVILKAKNTKEAAAEWLALGQDLAAEGLLDGEVTESQSIYKLNPVKDVQFDLFPCWIEEGRVFVFPHTFGEMTEADLLPLAQCQVNGNPIPKNPEMMLGLNYGKGWQTPDPTFVFPWRSAKRRFSTFLEGVA